MRILILFAHPRLENSRVHNTLLSMIPESEFITFHDLYEEYPHFNIDIQREKDLLLQHDIIIWQHPFFWYSCPPLLKQWIDMVLDFGWAYGPGGTYLTGKYVLSVVSTGGANEAYQPEGYNRFTINHFLAPFDQTVHLCHMRYLPPFLVQGTHRLSSENLKHHVANYRTMLVNLQDEKFIESIPSGVVYFNELIEKSV